MEALITLVGSIPLSTVILFLAAIVFLYKIYNKIKDYIISEHEFERKREEKLDKIEETVLEYKEKQDAMNKSIEELKDSQKRIEYRQDEIENERRKHALNTLRDRLLQAHRYYTNEENNPKFAWTKMEEESFNALFSDYEDLGGDGYMHTVVQPEMARLKVIPMHETEEISELMYSRK